MKTVEVVTYSPSWPEMFEMERQLLGGTLGRTAKAIHHIGSTAVPGLAAKPIIDILIEVTSLEELDALNEKMAGIGYLSRGEYGIPGRRYFQKGGENRSHQAHAFASGDFNLERHLAFRDYLRANPEIAREYGELKKQVARECGNDLGRYCDGKDAYVKRLEAVALRRIRPASVSDAATICAIYNHYIANTCITFEEEAVPETEMARRIEEITASLPWLVWEEAGEVAGYAYASKWENRSAYRYSVESTVYLRHDVTGRGIGQKLYESLISKLHKAGIHSIMGGIALPNEASQRLHEKAGFRKVAHFEQVGWKFERWIDVGYWELIFPPVA